MSKSENYYDILEIDKSADAETIKKAFRRLAIKHHPDKNQGNKESEEQFKKINEAYETLSDPNKKQEYDEFGPKKRGQNQNDNFNGFNDFNGFNGFNNFNGFRNGKMNFTFDPQGMDDFFGFNVGQQYKQVKQKDIKSNFGIKLNQALNGGTAKLTVKRLIECEHCFGLGATTDKNPKQCKTCNGVGFTISTSHSGNFQRINKTQCNACHGLGVESKKCTKCNGSCGTHATSTVEVEIPKGVFPGTTVKVAGMGNAVFEDEKLTNGDLYLFIDYHPSQDKFVLTNNGLYTELNVPIDIIIAKKPITINVLNVKDVEIKIDSTESGHIYTVNEAFDSPKSKIPLLVKVFITIPKKKLSEEEIVKLSQVLKEVYGESSVKF